MDSEYALFNDCGRFVEGHEQIKFRSESPDIAYEVFSKDRHFTELLSFFILKLASSFSDVPWSAQSEFAMKRIGKTLHGFTWRTLGLRRANHIPL